MGKNDKKKKNKEEEYDYSDINYSGDIRHLMSDIADSLEGYIDYIETFVIFSGITEKEWEKNIKTVKKLIKKLRKGNPSVFNIDELNNVLASEHQIIVGR